MEHTDIAVIGAGVLGCFAARALTAYDLHVTVLEAREDACTGITRANTGIVYTGCDTAPGTLKTELCVRANREFDALCRELDVRFSRCGSLMLAFGARAEGVLRRKLAAGRAAGVPGLRLLDRAETLALEPGVSGRVTMSLYAPGTGTVNPWELGLAAFENARRNGARFRFGEEVTRMTRRGRGFVLETPKGEYTARCVVNCAGLNAATVRELTQLPSVRIFPTAGDYLVLDDTVPGAPRHVLFHEPEEKGKGLTLVPTVDGNVLLGPTERPRESAADWATAQSGLAQLRALCAEVVPALPLDAVIRSFSALRPNPFYVHAAAGQWVSHVPAAQHPVHPAGGGASMVWLVCLQLRLRPVRKWADRVRLHNHAGGGLHRHLHVDDHRHGRHRQAHLDGRLHRLPGGFGRHHSGCRVRAHLGCPDRGGQRGSHLLLCHHQAQAAIWLR